MSEQIKRPYVTLDLVADIANDMVGKEINAPHFGDTPFSTFVLLAKATERACAKAWGIEIVGKESS